MCLIIDSKYKNDFNLSILYREKAFIFSVHVDFCLYNLIRFTQASENNESILF